MIIRVECTIIEDDDTFIIEMEGPEADPAQLEASVMESLGLVADEVRIKITEVPGTIH
jgi:hypothetical protein